MNFTVKFLQANSNHSQYFHVDSLITITVISITSEYSSVLQDVNGLMKQRHASKMQCYCIFLVYQINSAFSFTMHLMIIYKK